MPGTGYTLVHLGHSTPAHVIAPVADKPTVITTPILCKTKLRNHKKLFTRIQKSKGAVDVFGDLCLPVEVQLTETEGSA
ncbi:hypothetical protein TSMEX_008767 [Taenia solium]|eukprot:TsM_000289000 transcript=TsM_000289000 gene=TsM_000289000